MAFNSAATRNSTWIATKALSMIGAASVDNPPSASDMALALDRLDTINQDLADRGIYYQPDLDQTPASVAKWIANALALDLKPDFGDRTPVGQDAIQPQTAVDANLRRIGAENLAYGPQKVSYF